MTAVELFQFHDHQLRAVVADGEPWFVAADVARILGYRDAATAVRSVRDHHRGTQSVRTPGGTQQMTVVSLPGLNRLVMRSDVEQAEPFQDWVTDDVLPQIQTTGSYSPHSSLPDLTTPEGVLAMAEQFVSTARELVSTRAELAEVKPAAESWNTLATAQGDYLVADAAKILSRDPNIRLGQQRLFTLLGELGWIYRAPGDQRWRTRQTAIETGRLCEMPMSHYHPRTGELVLDAPQIRVTVKGLGWLHQHLGGVDRQQLALPAS